MRNLSTLLVVSSIAFGAAGFMACESDPATADDAGTSDSGNDSATVTPDASAPTDASTTSDATSDATDAQSSASVSGSLEVRAAGSLPTTAKLGTLTPTRGSVQVRPKPSGGSVVTVLVGEDKAATNARTLELSIFDDTGTFDAGEKFPADAPTQTVVPLRRVRLETFQSDGKSWRTEGDGELSVVAVTAGTVTLQLKNLGQFDRGGARDIFVVDGTVTLPIVKLPDTSGGTASLTFSNVLPEPITNDAANVVATPSTLASTSATLSDKSYPFTNDRRSAALSDVATGTTRNLRVAFPSGHLPRVGQSLPLDKFDRVSVVYFEGTAISGAAGEKIWEADQGSMVVEARTPTSITLRLDGARMQSESPDAKGLFTLDGTLTVPVAGE